MYRNMCLFAVFPVDAPDRIAEFIQPGLDFSDLASDDDEPDWCSFDPDNYDWNDVKDSVDKLEGYSIDEILKIMRSFWSERDKKSDWIQFSAW